MTRLAILGILIVAFALLVRALWPSSKKEEGPEPTEMVQDPNCGTYIPRAEALQKTVRGHAHYFCSEKCAGEFAQKQD